jgi:hypothetical protein
MADLKSFFGKVPKNAIVFSISGKNNGGFWIQDVNWEQKASKTKFFQNSSVSYPKIIILLQPSKKHKKKIQHYTSSLKKPFFIILQQRLKSITP